MLEVLISMFVLMIGLMGVASLFPVGGFYMARGDRFDRGNVLAQQALDEMRTRQMLQPDRWLHASVNPPFIEHTRPDYQTPPVIHPNDEGVDSELFNINDPNQPWLAGRAFVIDPLGVATVLDAAGQAVVDANTLYSFPYWDLSGTNPDGDRNVIVPADWQNNIFPGYTSADPWPIRRVTLPGYVHDNNGALVAAGPMSLRSAETVFRLRDELSVELPDDGVVPAQQLWEIDANTGAAVSRSWQGNYSWLATVVPVATAGITALQPVDPGYGSHFYEVSVAILHKRVAEPTIESERSISAEMDVDSRQIAIFHEDDRTIVDAALKDLRSGEWIAVAGVNEANGDFLLKWYRVLSLDEETVTDDHGHPARLLTLDGPDWPRPANGSSIAEGLRAIVLPGVVTVVTQALPMENEGLWSVQ